MTIKGNWDVEIWILRSLENSNGQYVNFQIATSSSDVQWAAFATAWKSLLEKGFINVNYFTYAQSAHNASNDIGITETGRKYLQDNPLIHTIPVDIIKPIPIVDNTPPKRMWQILKESIASDIAKAIVGGIIFIWFAFLTWNGCYFCQRTVHLKKENHCNEHDAHDNYLNSPNNKKELPCILSTNMTYHMQCFDESDENGEKKKTNDCD